MLPFMFCEIVVKQGVQRAANNRGDLKKKKFVYIVVMHVLSLALTFFKACHITTWNRKLLFKKI